MRMLTLALVLANSDDRAAEEALQAFKTGIRSPELNVRVAAVSELGACRHERTMRVLAGCLVTDDKAVRVAAARALGAFDLKKPQASVMLAEGLVPNGREPEVQAAILKGLKDLGQESALVQAYRFLDDRNLSVAEAAVEITGAVRSRSSVDPLIRLMRKQASAGDGYTSGDGRFDVPPDEQLRERGRKLQAAAVKALQSITAEKWSTAGEWEAWWKRNSATFRVKS